MPATSRSSRTSCGTSTRACATGSCATWRRRIARGARGRAPTCARSSRTPATRSTSPPTCASGTACASGRTGARSPRSCCCRSAGSSSRSPAGSSASTSSGRAPSGRVREKVGATLVLPFGALLPLLLLARSPLYALALLAPVATCAYARAAAQGVSRQSCVPLKSPTQTEPNAERATNGSPTTRDRVDDRVGRGVDARDRAVADVRDPLEPVRPARAVGRALADLDRRDDLVRRGIDMRDAARGVVGDPDAVVMRVDAELAAVTDRDERQRVRRRVDARDVVAVLQADPDRAGALRGCTWASRSTGIVFTTLRVFASDARDRERLRVRRPAEPKPKATSHGFLPTKMRFVTFIVAGLTREDRVLRSSPRPRAPARRRRRRTGRCRS